MLNTQSISKPRLGQRKSAHSPVAGATSRWTAEQETQAREVRNALASKLGLDPRTVSLSSLERKGFNAGNCDFAVSDEMQISAFSEGIEVKLEAAGEKFVYRGLDTRSGRFGLDVPNDDYWIQDARGIYIPDAGSNGEFA